MLAELHNVSKRYGHQWALNQLSMNIEEGETLLLTGHNGAGKTTLLRLLATVMRPTHGTIKILGQDSRRGFEEIRPHIGLLSHQNHLYNQHCKSYLPSFQPRSNSSLFWFPFTAF